MNPRDRRKRLAHVWPVIATALRQLERRLRARAMSREDMLRAAMAQLNHLIMLTRALDLEALRDGLEQSEIGDVLGPILYPTEWTARHGLEEQLRQIVRAVIDFRRRLNEILGEPEQHT